MSKMKKNRKKLFAILLQAALVSTAMTMPAYAAKTPGIGSDARIGDDATGPVLTGGNTEMEEETSPYTKEQLEDGTLEYGEIAWRIEGYNSTYLNLRSQLYSQATSQSAGTDRFINTILTIVIKGGNLSFFRCFCCRNNTCKKNCHHTCHQPFCNSSYIFHHLITFLLSIIFLSAFCPINAQNMYHHMSIVTLHKKRIVILCKIK